MPERNHAAGRSRSCTTDRHAAESRAARDQLRDLFELLDIGARVDLGGDGAGRLAIQIGEMANEQAVNLADALLPGARSRHLLLSPGTPLYSLRHSGVGVVTALAKNHVTLLSLAEGVHWHVGAGELRAATLDEITAASGEGGGDDGAM
jgi:hypothetical protein